MIRGTAGGEGVVAARREEAHNRFGAQVDMCGSMVNRMKKEPLARYFANYRGPVRSVGSPLSPSSCIMWRMRLGGEGKKKKSVLRDLDPCAAIHNK